MYIYTPYALAHVHAFIPSFAAQIPMGTTNVRVERLHQVRPAEGALRLSRGQPVLGQCSVVRGVSALKGTNNGRTIAYVRGGPSHSLGDTSNGLPTLGNIPKLLISPQIRAAFASLLLLSPNFSLVTPVISISSIFGSKVMQGHLFDTVWMRTSISSISFGAVDTSHNMGLSDGLSSVSLFTK